ncbi:MAG: YfiM family protein [Bacteroidia bacterium]|nr:YfiM family protein [Bacteroidia bacterium]
MKYRFLFLVISLSVLGASQGMGQRRQDFHIQYNFKPNDHFIQNDSLPNKKRSRWVNGIALGGYGLSALYMGTVWYAQEDLSTFHFFDDSHEWKQIDKMGHALGGYHSSRWMIGLYKWSGMGKNRAIIQGATAGFLAMSSIEVFDAFGESWGFSWSDVGANFVGASLAAGNQLLWNEDRIQLKVSYRRSPYAGDPEFERLFGSNYAEWLLKDYNGHTFWLSARVHSFLPEGNFKDKYPRWLNVAVGYGANGLEGGYGDPSSDWRTREYRQLYFSFDIDVRNIRTKNPYLHALLQTVSIFRIQLPAVRIDRNGSQFVWFQ